MTKSEIQTHNRRGFMSTTAVASLAASTMVHSARAAKASPRPLRLAVIGCGGRGNGAIDDSLTINSGVTLAAAADLRLENCEKLFKTISKKHPEKVDTQSTKLYSGLDGYKQILGDPDIDLVLLTTSPGFRPLMLQEAVQAGKHVFAEKPVCIDSAGYHLCQASHDLAVKNNTAIVTGTQYRRQVNYIAAVEQIRNGAIGDIINVTARYCTSGIWYRPRKENMSDTEYQLTNWMHFIWLSGDQICEQAVHNIDTFNWVMGANPISAYASGGRFTRPSDSEMWDSMSVAYEYPDGRTVSFMCRQIPGSQGLNDNVIYGTQGRCQIGAANSGSRIFDSHGKQVWEKSGKIKDAYREEHRVLVESIRNETPVVELKQTADSSMVGVLGRVSAYTGKKVTWDYMTTQSTLDLFPTSLTWGGALPSKGFAIPGKTKLV
ncbi:MAG: Gfo/Idh/MocA family oxidoreductase [Pirellulales bacterium]